MLHSIFSDESEAFRSPRNPSPGDKVTVRLRVERVHDVRAGVLVGTGGSRVEMRKAHSDGLFDWYEATLTCGFEPITYRFSVEGVDWEATCQRDGTHPAGEPLDPRNDFRIIPGSAVPAWARGALQYQIFPDRFANGSEGNDVVDGECIYDDAPVRKVAQWDAPPAADDYRCFYGGDLQGVRDKLDYLQSLGVEAIYLNPVFVSPSSHKYDAQDYLHIDPHLAVICDDEEGVPAPDDTSNLHAARYIRRTTSDENLRRSDELFAELCGEIHRRGMRIMLDGVFNHCGSFNAWMDREGIYRKADGRTTGAFENPDSPYRAFFNFDGGPDGHYESWWGFPTLPKLNYEQSEELCNRVLEIARHWAMPPYSIDGWRLDVAADLGHGEAFNHAFWRRFRAELKAVNPELLLVAEHYGDPSEWLLGDQWDTVMNYDAFMDPLTYFLTGMEKHSDARDDDLYLDGAAFCETMRKSMARMSWDSLSCAMNQLSNHDHSRFLTRTNRTVGRTETAGPEAAGEDIDKRVLREAVVVQMTWPGAPTVYYGDEAGQVGWTDPDCRRTYPWGGEDRGLIELHRELARVRRDHPSLRTGSLAMLCGGDGWIAFGRFLEGDRVAVACNNAEHPQLIALRVRDLGFEDGHVMRALLETTGAGFSSRGDDPRVVGKVEGGFLALPMPPRSAAILI